LLTLKGVKMTLQQVLKYLEVNPSATIRQTNWFPEESLNFNQETGVFVDELGYEYSNLDLFGATPWEATNLHSQLVM
jgi:hypothetical protein